MKRLTSKNRLTEFEAANLSLTNLYMRLKDYEDAEEQGRVVVLSNEVASGANLSVTKLREACLHAYLDGVQSERQRSQRNGHWIKSKWMNEQCICCLGYFPVSEFKARSFAINFCPNCGADMREES